MLPQAAETIDSNSQSASSQKMHILILDDNEVDRKRVARLSKQSGIHADITEAENLTEFREKLAKKSYDIVFIDYLLASESGLDAIDILVEHPNQTSAAPIMIAGEGQIQVAVEAMRKGSADYILKSTLSVDTMQKSIASAVERQMMRAALATEQARREDLESAIRRFAHSSTAEMRSILASTLRRVRNLKAYSPGGGYAGDIQLLEQNIDALWESLPNFTNGIMQEIGETKLTALN